MTLAENFYNLNTAQPQTLSNDEPFWRTRHVDPAEAHRMVRGREAEVLQRLGVDWPPRRGDHIHCAYPDHPDKNPSMRLTDEGKVVCSCRQAHSVFDCAINLRKARDYNEASCLIAELIGRADAIREPHTPREGITLDALAALKRLPVDYLKGIGLTDDHHRGAPAVKIPYWHEDGSQLDPRYRIAATGDLKIVSAKGAKTALYGRWNRDSVLERGFVIIVEGESDTWTLWHRGFPADVTP
jgi:hypothetical protein